MNLFLLTVLILISPLWAQRQKIDPISFGPVNLAEERIAVNLKTFKIKQEGRYKVSATFIPNTVQWIRLDKSLLVPRALIKVSFSAPPSHDFSWEYAHQKIIPLYNNKSKKYNARVFISLFESLPLELYEGKSVVTTLRIEPAPQKHSHLIDYSCAPYSIEVEGLQDDFLSMGCKIQRTGKLGQEKPYLEVLVTSASYRLKDLSEPPYLIAFHKTGEANLTMINHDGREEKITIKAKLPEKLPRLKLAFGYGPYLLDSKNKFGDKRSEIAPTVMLYGNLALNESNSLRFFDSYSQNIAKFHNWGVYFAWDLAEFCDQRCLLTSLIGAQGVNYRYSSNDTTQSEMIYPQGFEFIYKHPFGNLNYRFSYGMFASFSGMYDYTNIWVRYGKGFFWELNFIEWSREQRQASMFGLSVGFPIATFL
jgi:hypothetical protein